MSIRQHIRFARRDGALYFEARDTGDRQIAEFLRFIDAYVQLSSLGGFVPAIKTSAPTHENVVQFLNRIAQLANGPSAARSDGTVEAKRFVAHCDEHSRYLQSKCVGFGINPVNTWSGGLRISALDPEAERVVLTIVHEMVEHFYEFIRERAPSIVPTTQLATDDMDRLLGLLPDSVAALKTHADITVILPWFFKSLDVPGDICEFGCYQGTMSIKFAFAAKALGFAKTVYAFDTFEGFESADPAGGVLGKGAYSDTGGAFEQLTRWSSAIPVRPIKGDARETCKTLTGPLAFVWLDLDFSTLMEPVLSAIWPLLDGKTIIGIDDVGRPDTPSVAPWVDKLVRDGRLIELARHDGFQRFFRPNK